MLYLTVAFVALVPLASYHVVMNGLPKKILLFVIPAYVVLALGSYIMFKNLKSLK